MFNLTAVLGLLMMQTVAPSVAVPKTPNAPAVRPATPDERSHDWRYGPVVYQVFVDRFAPPANPGAKRDILDQSTPLAYLDPKLSLPKPLRPLNRWTDLPKRGIELKSIGLWSHELEFWGGDLASLTGKLGYVQNLGADVLYLMPVQRAFTNHKYDAQNFEEVSPELGTRKELLALADNLHHRDMKIILDGVFNHMGSTSDFFVSASDSKHGVESKYRQWFFFGTEYWHGYRAWAGVGNLPALNLEKVEVREYLWKKPDSVVQKYLREGIDGWRLDVAFEIGPKYLSELTQW